MKKLNMIIILGILSIFSSLNAAEIKEIKTLESYSNEILGETTSNNKTPTNIKKIEISKNKINGDTSGVIYAKKAKETVSNNATKENASQPSSESEGARVSASDIEDIYNKVAKEGIIYLNKSSTPFTGTFGIVIDNKIESYEQYKNGLLDGETAWFSRTTGKKIFSEFYSKGKLNGEQKTYYDNGKLKSIVKYVNDRVNGIISYDINGKILHQSNFENGNGTWKFFWSNGKLSEEGKYTAGRKDGIWKRYSQNGNLESTVIYDKGRILKESWQ